MSSPPPPSSAPRFQAWLDRFFEAFYARRPVDATFIGRHEHDGALPDWSDSGLSAAVSEMRSLGEALSDLPPEPLPRVV